MIWWFPAWCLLFRKGQANLGSAKPTEKTSPRFFKHPPFFLDVCFYAVRSRSILDPWWSFNTFQCLASSQGRGKQIWLKGCVPYHSFGSSGFLSGSLGCIQSKKVAVYFFSNQKRAFHTKTHMKRMQLFIFLNHYKDFLVFPDSQVPSPYESWCLRRRKGRNQGGQYQKLFRFPVHDF